MNLKEYTYEASVIFSPSTVRLRRKIAEESESEMERCPEDFGGDVACIFFKFDYVFPYEKLDGLRRYILAVRDRTGLRNSFRGYIALDLSEWSDHVDEDYFRIFIMYLADHSDGIHYLLFFGAREASQREPIMKMLAQYMRVKVIDKIQRGGAALRPKRSRSSHNRHEIQI